MQSLGHVRLESSKIFDPLIERQHEREKLIGLINTYHRYKWFLEMPSTLEEHLNKNKMSSPSDQDVVSCYKKSKAFMEDHPNITLFAKIFQEIERVITGYKDKL